MYLDMFMCELDLNMLKEITEFACLDLGSELINRGVSSVPVYFGQVQVNYS